MALSIAYDGTGIVAYADGQTTDTGGGSWGELGAGTVGDNPDVYLYGSNSFASKYASKAGRTYYADNGTIDYSSTGDLIYMLVNIQSNGAFRTYGTGTFNGPFNMIVGQDTSNLRHWNIAAKGASNGWTGGWKADRMASMVAVDSQLMARTREIEALLIEHFPEGAFESWIEGESESLIEFYSAIPALDVFDAVQDRIGEIMGEDDLSVFVIPLLYYVIQSMSEKLGGKKAAEPQPTPAGSEG